MLDTIKTLLLRGWRLLKEVLRLASRDEISVLSGNIAYTSLLSFFPFLISLTALAGFLGNEELSTTVIDYLLSIAPEQVVSPFADDIHALLTRQSGKILTASIFFSTYVAARGVESIRTGLNLAYGYQEKRPWLMRIFQNILFVVGGAFVMLALAVLIVFAPIWWGVAVDWVPALDTFTPEFNSLRVPIGLGLMFIALLLGHAFIPYKNQSIKTIMPGILVTIALWYVAAQTFTLYVTKFSRAQIMYASLGNIVSALLFVYISAFLILLGAEINQALKLRSQSKDQAKQALAVAANDYGNDSTGDVALCKPDTLADSDAPSSENPSETKET